MAGPNSAHIAISTSCFFTMRMLYPLWDIGLKVGHSVRHVYDCVQVANTDMQSKTSLIEARLITGNPDLFKKFQWALFDKCVTGHEEEYIAARVQDQATRHAKFGNSPLLQEPNIKNGCGGLRDYQNLHWMAFFKYRTRTSAELKARGLVSDAECRQLEAAYNFLLRVRNELHYQVDRPAELLLKNLQPTVAHGLGYPDRSPSRRLERFMRDVYTHLRNIYLITRTLEQRLALLPQPQRLLSVRRIIRTQLQKAKQQLLDGFRILDGEIQPVSNRVFRDQPRRLMRVFLYAQQRGLKLNPDLVQLIRNELALMDRAFLRDSHVRDTFLELLNQRGSVAPVLRAMHEAGLLGKYLPEFGKLTCLVQHEFYHQYTADEHTLVCLEKLDRVWEAQDPPYRHYTEMFRKIERPSVLYLALMLHDAGKAFPTSEHQQVGGHLAMRVARRLNLDTGAANTLRLLVENHLLMAQISQRRDLEDPAVIRNFARQMQTPENLLLLTLHTLADSLGTSEQLWNGFKDTLLLTLQFKAMQVLSGATEFIVAEAKERELLAQEVRQLAPQQISDEEVTAHFASLPARYFLIHAAKEIVDDLTLTHRFMNLQLAEEEKALEPVTSWHNEPDRGYSVAKIGSWDRAGLFCKITGSFSATGINILSARIFTRADGIVLDTFYVTDAATGNLVNREEREKFEQILRQVLTGGLVDFAALIARQKNVHPAYQSIAGERIPTTIHFDNESSETRTVIEIETEDRLGLLYVVSQALTEAELDISLAKISTEKGAAIDSFYVHEHGGDKILSPERRDFIKEKILQAIASLDPE
ncbi:MAG: [protein-PII] uridylyltransferase [Verrucomicrobia bacterium]|nr:MAG: [protein-PII] uridylyltransferase [Verrucomicrobiota bacterium]